MWPSNVRFSISSRSKSPAPFQIGSEPVAQGNTNADIADELVISVGTVKTHGANVAAKLGVRNRVGIAAWAWEHGIAQPSEYT